MFSQGPPLYVFCLSSVLSSIFSLVRFLMWSRKAGQGEFICTKVCFDTQIFSQKYFAKVYPQDYCYKGLYQPGNGNIAACFSIHFGRIPKSLPCAPLVSYWFPHGRRGGTTNPRIYCFRRPPSSKIVHVHWFLKGYTVSSQKP